MNNCNVCGKAGSLQLFGQLNHNLQGVVDWYYCGDCHAYSRGIGAKESDQLSLIRENEYGKSEVGERMNAFKDVLFSTCLAYLKKYLVPGKLVLDLGASFGGLVFKCKQAGYQVRATDVLPEAVDFLNSKGIPAVQAYCMKQIPESLCTGVDAITLIDVHYYWEQVFSEFQQVKERLNAGGVLLIRASDKSWLMRLSGLIPVHSKWRQFLMRRAVHDHRSIIPVASLLPLLEDLGFEQKLFSIYKAIPSQHISWTSRFYYGFAQLLYSMTGWYLAPSYLIVLVKK
jgi:2-polyprenyl-3-methyl-5-hydroxy-6-metoxy-1,4-benzoquinol methylase